MTTVSNIRELLGHLIGQRLIEITQDDEDEEGDRFVELMFENGNTVRFFTVDSEHYRDGCFCFSDPNPDRIDEEDFYTPTAEEKAAGKWAVIEMDGRDPVEGHVVPLTGKQHYLNQTCWCRPKTEVNPHGMLCVIHEASE